MVKIMLEIPSNYWVMANGFVTFNRIYINSPDFTSNVVIIS